MAAGRPARHPAPAPGRPCLQSNPCPPPTTTPRTSCCSPRLSWSAATNIAELIPKVPGLVSQFLPSMQYLLIAENQYTESGLATMQNLVAAMMRLQRSPQQTAVLEVIDLLHGWLADNPELMRIFAIWIRAVLLRQSKHDLALPKVQDLKELKMTLATRFEEWAQQHRQEGLETGLQKGLQKGLQTGLQKGQRDGEARILQRLLVARFGPLSLSILAQLEHASTEQIEAWVDRAITARSLHDIFDAI